MEPHSKLLHGWYENLRKQCGAFVYLAVSLFDQGEDDLIQAQRALQHLQGLLACWSSHYIFLCPTRLSQFIFLCPTWVKCPRFMRNMKGSVSRDFQPNLNTCQKKSFLTYCSKIVLERVKMRTSSNQAMMCLRHSGRSCVRSLWDKKVYSHENPAHILPLTSMPPSSTEKRNSCLIIVVIIMDGHSNQNHDHLDYDVVHSKIQC